jgi:hypothetical protein
VFAGSAGETVADQHRPPGDPAALRQRREQGQRGKLTWAARQWARIARPAAPTTAARDDDAKALADARAFGLDDDSLAELTDALSSPPPIAEADYAGVWLVHAEIVRAFLAVSTQWRTASIGGGGFVVMGGGAAAPRRLVFVSLDYASVRAGLDAEEIAVTPELWRGLRIMEAAACAALNESNN